MSGLEQQPVEVRITGLRKRFDRLDVLRSVDVTIQPGRVTALVGPNAAGKTTLIKAILGLVQIRPGEGDIRFDGTPVRGDHRYRERIGYMPQDPRFPAHLTGREVLSLLCELRGNPSGTDDELLERFRLSDQLAKPVRDLSGGTRQKLNAVVAFLFRPSLLILDEPTAGLDPLAAAILKDKIASASSRGVTVLLTSHVMSEVEELAQDVVFMVDGEVRFQGSVGSLIESTGESRLEGAVAALLQKVA